MPLQLRQCISPFGRIGRCCPRHALIRPIDGDGAIAIERSGDGELARSGSACTGSNSTFVPNNRRATEVNIQNRVGAARIIQWPHTTRYFIEGIAACLGKAAAMSVQ